MILPRSVFDVLAETADIKSSFAPGSVHCARSAFHFSLHSKSKQDRHIFIKYVEVSMAKIKFPLSMRRNFLLSIYIRFGPVLWVGSGRLLIFPKL